VIKFGIFDHLDDSGAPTAELYADRLAFIEACDRAGFYCYHLAEHHGTPLGNAPSPSVFLAAAIQRSRRLRLCPLVYVLPLHHPLRVYEEICMLDQLSGGRLEVGFGGGAVPLEIGLYGADPGQAQALYREGYAIIQTALAADQVDHAGTHYTIAGFPSRMRPVQRPHPPFWYATVRPESTPWVARNAINVMSLGPAGLAGRVSAAYRAEWASLGRNPAAVPLIGVTRHVVVGDTDQAALAIAARAYATWRASFEHLWISRGVKFDISWAYPHAFDELLALGTCVAGAPDTVRLALAAQIAEGDLNYMACQMAFGAMSREETCRSAELFGAQIIGRV
jgi:alkanesulfonate monooxygenase SsuD/methylene tetrahydromethanopterin reductase-like flavin-dependent oxidoreductase (luciferase family)